MDVAAAKSRRAAGFTLMEVMVAITIFALIGIASYRMLNAVAEAGPVERASVPCRFVPLIGDEGFGGD